jgi:hypothetical protein
MVYLKFAGYSKRYDLANTAAAVVQHWMYDRITEEEMVALLHAFKSITRVGPQSISFLKDIHSEKMMKTSAWFHENGLGPNENP